MEEGFDYDGHFRWFARELKHEPNPRRLFQDAFNAAPLETIPRDRALHMLQFYLSAREREEFPGGEYPPEVTRQAESLLRVMETRHGLTFKPEPTPRTSSRTGSPGDVHPAVKDFLVTGGGGSLLGVETTRDLDGDVDFIRTNRFGMNPYYKPIVFQMAIAAFREHGARRLRQAGFQRRRDAATDIILWGRLSSPIGKDASGSPSLTTPLVPNPDRHNPIVFLHGLGLGIAPYAEYVCALPTDRPVVAPEWPNISYGADRSHRYPSPSEISNFLERATRRAAEDAWARDDAGADQSAIVDAGKRSVCDVIAHSYGTVCLTAFRRHYPGSTRRRVYVDPVCFLPSFGSYLRYGFDDHLADWTEMCKHLRARAKDPTEPMSMGNLVLASWFVKGDASTQQLMKRLLFPHEAWERGPLTERDMVVLSGLDEIVGSIEISERFARAWPGCKVVLQRQWQHGGFLLESDPEGVNHDIVAHVTGDAASRHVQRKPGLVKRAWRFGFAKRRKKKLKRQAEDLREATKAAEAGA